jgi:hypothetical protein
MVDMRDDCNITDKSLAHSSWKLRG